jgi:hypothetical protein
LGSPSPRVCRITTAENTHLEKEADKYQSINHLFATTQQEYRYLH